MSRVTDALPMRLRMKRLMKRLEPIVPELRSPILCFHIFFAWMAYAFCGVLNRHARVVLPRCICHLNGVICSLEAQVWRYSCLRFLSIDDSDSLPVFATTEC